MFRSCISRRLCGPAERKVQPIGLPENIVTALPYIPWYIGLIAGADDPAFDAAKRNESPVSRCAGPRRSSGNPHRDLRPRDDRMIASGRGSGGFAFIDRDFDHADRLGDKGMEGQAGSYPGDRGPDQLARGQDLGRKDK